MKTQCPYFKKGHCVSKYRSQMQMKMAEIVFCAMDEHVTCPIYIESIRREEEKKLRRK